MKCNCPQNSLGQHAPGCIADNIPISNIRKVTLWFAQSPQFLAHESKSSYMVPAQDVDTFIEASKRLHYSPGINPHNGGQTLKIYKITVTHFKLAGPFWWTTPDLMKNNYPKGASVFNEIEDTVWGGT